MLYQIRVFTIALLIYGSKCSRIVDIYTQRALNVSDYCLRIGDCGEGSHVMCLYNSARVMGPACYDFIKNITITPDYAQLILSITNRIRSKIATGQVKAKNNLTLPRGYGLFKVVWDEELATFAQVWANQCILRLDICRSSKKFPKVGQALGMTRFSLDNWMPIHKSNFNDTTLTTEKVKYALKSVMKAWWNMKEMVTAEDVKAFNGTDLGMLRNKFLNLVYGPFTHVGCGISAYKEYAYKGNMAHIFFNCVQVVCNFSSRPKHGEPIYTVEPPTKVGHTVRCGCPLGFDEDEACLCYESGRKIPYLCKDKDQCKPSVVVLPIFTVEDAPASRIRDNLHPGGRQRIQGGNNSIVRVTTNDEFDRFDTLNNRIPLNNYNDIFNNIPAIDYKSALTRRFPTHVESRYFNNEPKLILVPNTTRVPYLVAGIKHVRGHFSQQKQSIFSKAGIFELPIKKRKQVTMNLVHQAKDKGFKKDVAPRKDFTKVQKLVSSYLDKKRNGKLFDVAYDSNGYMSHGPVTYSDYNRTTKQKIKGNKKNVIKYDDHKLTYLNNFNITKDKLKHPSINAPGEDDTKLMSLLDKLEEEVKKIDLNSNEKGLFDNRIRKIYGTLVGKQPNLVNQRLKLLSKDSINESITGDINFQTNKYNNLIEPKHNYRDFENDYNSLANYDNKLDRDYGKKLHSAKGMFRGINQNVEDRKLRNTYDLRENFKGNHENHNLKTEGDDYYPLSSERRRYYHQKLANLQKKIKNMKRSGHQEVPEDRHIRYVRPTKQEKHQRRRRPNDHVNTYYMPDRARFLHGF